MMYTITATEFKQNFGKYSLLAQKEVIFVTSYGRVIYKLVPPHADRTELAKSLVGILPKNATIGEDVNERD